MASVGIIGGGNMGSAMMGGLIRSGRYAKDALYLYERTETRRKALGETFGITTTGALPELLHATDIILCALKPKAFPEVLRAHADDIDPERQIFVSIAAGLTLDQLGEILGTDRKIVRVMPNTPALVGEGMSGVCSNARVSEEEAQQVLDIFRCFGKAELVPEALMDAVTGVSGSGPAYVFLFLEALADGAVLEGIPRAQAYTFATQLVYGAAKMAMETDKHPGELKDMVCSPAGTTIAGVNALEQRRFRAAVISAVHAAAERSREMQGPQAR